MDAYQKDVLAIQQLATTCELLLVEDDPAVLERLEQFFKKLFDNVHTATDATTALAIYKRRQHPDTDILLITDIDLGAISGIELTGSIKAFNPNQKVIAISGTDDRNVFVDAIQCGVDRFILKPINFRDLINALRTLLEEIMQKRELEKSQRLLEESRLYALKLLKEQDEFLKNAIHEMHTPLSVIITNIDLMRMSGIDNESLDAIEAASRIIQNSYQDMTYLMKRNHVRDEKSTVDIAVFIRERVQYFTCIANVNDIALNLHIDTTDLTPILFSVLKLGRIVDNTLSNAIKYSFHPGEVAVNVGVDEGSVYIEITNRGPVIQSKEKIFERFYREERHKGGYGLGLNIVGEICDEEQVGIKVSSSEEEGTCFRYTFPNESATRQKQGV